MKTRFNPKTKIFLAPMQEINDIAFRLLCKKAGALTWTGLESPLNPKELILDDKPILQIFAKDTRNLKEYMKKYDKKVYGWSFNLGCPAKTARKHGHGAFMAHDLVAIEEILKTMRENTEKPLIPKIRKSKYANKILKIAEKYCDAIAVHSRTIPQGYSGEPDIQFADKIKANSKIPVIYSGNVTKDTAEKFLKDFDYVMIGREAVGRPNIFWDKDTITFDDYLKLAKKYKLPFRQIKFQAMNFTKEKHDSKKIRLKIFDVKEVEDLEKVKI
ncbi:tRNA-dihydrouridine synthase family protein [Candidatus Pacearchaeota archaeon]|nr:tRNA-dihydrouridine synthase family protein [Candidatus Pacearchaeota archaeon]